VLRSRSTTTGATGSRKTSIKNAWRSEFRLRDIPFHAKQELSCSYKGYQLKKRFIPDLFVFDGIVVELKAVSQLVPEHEAQILNYLRITKQPLGYLINFGKRGGLDHKRFILSEFLPK
jgi:GxxExxY protein